MTATIGFIVPPAGQDAGYENAYAQVDGYVIWRMVNRVNLSVGYAIARCLKDDQGDYQKHAPRNKRWRPITAAAAARWLEGSR